MIEQVGIEASVLLSFIGPELAGERWKQWRVYFTDILPTGGGTQRLPRMESADAANAGYRKGYNVDPALEGVLAYERSPKEHPDPPVPNITRFGRGG